MIYYFNSNMISNNSVTCTAWSHQDHRRFYALGSAHGRAERRRPSADREKSIRALYITFSPAADHSVATVESLGTV